MLTTLACTRLGKMAGIPFNRESRLFTAEIQGASIGAFREWIQEYKVKDIAQWAEVEDSEEAARIYDASPYIGAAVYETKFTYFFEYAHGDSRLLRVTVSQTQPALLLLTVNASNGTYIGNFIAELCHYFRGIRVTYYEKPSGTALALLRKARADITDLKLEDTAPASSAATVDQVTPAGGSSGAGSDDPAMMLTETLSNLPRGTPAYWETVRTWYADNETKYRLSKTWLASTLSYSYSHITKQV